MAANMSALGLILPSFTHPNSTRPGISLSSGDNFPRSPDFSQSVDDQKMWVVQSPDFVVNSAVSIDLQSTNLVQYLRLVKLDKIVNDDVWRPKKLKMVLL